MIKITVLKEKSRNSSYIHYSSLQFCMCLKRKRTILSHTERREFCYINLEAAKANTTINKCLAFFTFWMSVLQSRQKMLMAYINISLLWRSMFYSEKMPWKKIYQSTFSSQIFVAQQFTAIFSRSLFMDCLFRISFSQRSNVFS